jgi:hypothetical protein
MTRPSFDAGAALRHKSEAMTLLFRAAGPLFPALLCAMLGLAPAQAQTTPGRAPEGATPTLMLPQTQSPARPQGQNGATSQVGTGRLFLSASFGGGSNAVVSGVRWRVYQQSIENGVHQLVAESNDIAPSLTLPDGDYIVHAAYGLAAAMRRVTINGRDVEEKIALNAGALRISGLLGDTKLQPNKLKIDVYVPERTGQPEKLVAANVKAGDTVRLPEGNYRIVSTYLDINMPASAPSIAGLPPSATNSVINAEVRIEAGKLTEATVRHRASNITLKLVNTPGGEALANTSFTVLTPGGDVIREMIGAFPRLVLAEGEYFVIARRDGKTHQMTFKVPSNSDREIEVMANGTGG